MRLTHLEVTLNRLKTKIPLKMTGKIFTRMSRSLNFTSILFHITTSTIVDLLCELALYNHVNVDNNN